MFEMIISAYRWIFLQMSSVFGLGWSIVLLSCICSALMAPLMRAVAGIVRREADYQSVILPQIAAIKAKYASDMDRHAHIQALYERYGYSPLSAVKKVLPLFVQIPFLLLTYFMLKGTAELSGVEFLFLGNLGEPDAILHLRLLPSPINLLPFVMTGVNLITVFATPGFTTRDQVQAVGISLLFLVMLYTAPSALLLYWTLNNVITMVRTLAGNRGAGLRLLGERLVLCGAALRSESFMAIFSVRNGLLAIRNLAILELFVFLPVMAVIFGPMPDRMDLDVETARPMSIRAGFELSDESGAPKLFETQTQGCPLGKHIDPVSFYFANRLAPEDIRVSFSRNDSEFVLKSATWVRHLLFRYDLHLEKREGGDYCPAGSPTFLGVEIPDVKFAHAAVAASQIGLLLLAILGACLGQKKESDSVWLQSIVLALVGALFFAVVLPGQTILANRDALNFPIGEIEMGMSASFVMWAVILFSSLQLVSVIFGRWPHFFLLLFLVYEYLQTGVLSIKAPALDGNMDYYWKMSPMLVDFAVIAGLGLLALVKNRWVRRRVVTLSLWLLAAFMISLVCAKSDQRKSAGKTGRTEPPWHYRRTTVLNGLRYSPSRNIIVLVLDSVQSDATYDVAMSNADLRAEFDGFTAFNNHVGMHDNTFTGTVGLMAGEYFVEGMKNAEHLAKCWGPQSFVRPYLDGGDPVYLMPGPTAAFSNRIDTEEPLRKPKIEQSVFHRRVKPMNFCLSDVLCLKTVPFFLKKWVLQVIYLGSVGSDGTEEECSLYPALAAKGISDERKTALIYIHSMGTHAPIRYDKDGNRIWTNKNNYKGLLGETHYLLKSAAAYLHELKARKLYDNSMIILTADHGCCFDTVKNPRLAKLHTRAVPFLWIKPIGAHGAFTETDAPTSHSRISALLKQARDKNLGIDSMIRTLTMPIRRFRLGRGKGLQDYYVDAEGNLVKP